MAVTIQQIYDITLGLISDNGVLKANDSNAYMAKTPKLLTLLQAELLPASSTIFKNMTDVVNLSDDVAVKILPYGLAAHLMIDENPNTAPFFNNRYEELKRKIPTTVKPITDVYGVV